MQRSKRLSAHVEFDPARGAIMADMLRKVAGSWVPETHEAHRISLTIAPRRTAGLAEQSR